MNKRDLLLEVGIEEIPARFILQAIEDFGDKIKDWFEEQKVEYATIETFSTPRRLAVLVKGVSEAQQDTVVESRGPAKKIALDEEGNWSKAAIGFSRSQGLTTDDIYFVDVKGVEYAYVKKHIKGEQTAQLLTQLGKLIESLPFPNNMYWGSERVRYVRPIRWLVALFGNEVIPFSIAGVETGAETNGHRFLGERVTIENPSNYEKTLVEQYVIVNYEKRKQMIVEQIKQIEQAQNWLIPMDEDLLEEVTNLVEYPTAFFGTFKENFLHLPEEVLITSMKSHQRYFPVKNVNGELMPNFIGVRNGNSDHMDVVIRGNEKVLQARLADADFFYKEDQKGEINEALEKLESIVYQEQIGTLTEKVRRVQRMTRTLGNLLSLSEEEIKLADRAAEICKFDLVSNMVNEFPELQGIMGEKYALEKGERKEVAKAIREHYLPRHAGDQIPTSTIGAIVSVADKIDTIVSAFAIDLIPTGSHDPYALRRQATGVVHILLEKQWNLSFTQLLQNSIDMMDAAQIGTTEGLLEKLMNFFKLRLKYVLQELNIRYDMIEAVLEGEIDYLPDLVDRARTLHEQKDSETFKETIESLSRVLNIAKQAEGENEIDPSLFENEAEQRLYNEYKKIKGQFEGENEIAAQFSLFVSLKPIITEYFDETMVMAEDERVKQNRLAQMKKLARLIGSYAKMTEIQAK